MSNLGRQMDPIDERQIRPGIEAGVVECFRRVQDGTKKIEMEEPSGKITAYRVGDIIRIDVKESK